MEIKCLPLGLIRSNCYCVTGDKGCIIIDAGFSSDKVLTLLKSHSDKEQLILLTHGHFDHIGGAEYLRKETGTPIAIGENDAAALSDNDVNMSTRFHAHYKAFTPDRLLKDEETFSVGDLSVRVMETAGHTAGGVCYLINGALFSGDTLFYESVGRTDHPFGDTLKLIASVKKLYRLPDDTPVYPGHGSQTTIRYEKSNNPFVREDS